MSARRSTRTNGARRCWPTWRMRRRCCPDHRLTSIFFGGGTPSLMEPSTVEAVIAAARDHWPAADDLEITLEANPNSAEAARFADLAARRRQPRSASACRASTMTPLAFLGRAHSARRGLARAGGRAIGSRSRQLRPDLRASRRRPRRVGRATLDRALGLGTEHLSLYQLTIEPGTRFATMVRAGMSSSRSTPTRAATCSS